jgi:hypothetical protein
VGNIYTERSDARWRQLLAENWLKDMGTYEAMGITLTLGSSSSLLEDMFVFPTWGAQEVQTGLYLSSRTNIYCPTVCRQLLVLHLFFKKSDTSYHCRGTGARTRQWYEVSDFLKKRCSTRSCLQTVGQ